MTQPTHRHIWRTVVVAGAMLGCGGGTGASTLPQPAQAAPTATPVVMPAPASEPYLPAATPPPEVITAEPATAASTPAESTPDADAPADVATADAKAPDAKPDDAKPDAKALPGPKPKTNGKSLGRVRGGVGSGTRPTGRGFVLA